METILEGMYTPAPHETPTTTEGQKSADKPTQPIELINELLAEMGPQKKQLLAILDFCREEQTSSDVDHMLAQLPEQRTSIYSGVTMRALLEQAGGLLYISHDVEPAEIFSNEGDLVLPDPVEPSWLTTKAGLACVAAQDPFGELIAAIENSDLPLEGFTLVLEYCSEQERTISDIVSLLEQSGFMSEDAMEATAFVSQLEDLGAIEWRGSWVTCELGKRYLAHQQG